MADVAKRIARFESVAHAPKPLLRGYSHALAAIAALGAGVRLVQVASGDGPTYLALLIYAVSAVLLFTTSALYHMGSWAPRTRALLRRLDYANIFAIMAGAYTPVAAAMLSGWWRVALPTIVWMLAIAGMVTVVARPSLSRRVRVAIYLALAWSAVLVSPVIVARLDGGSLLLLGITGVFGMGGALVYALQRPRLWPHIFGYHELFHLAVIGANVSFYLFVLQRVA